MCKLRGHNEEGRLFLVDTGAMVSVLPLNLYEEIDPYFRGELKTASKTLRAGNNSKCDVRGIADIDFEIADTVYKHPFYVCADSTQPILGIDFQTKVDMYVRPSQDKLCIGNKTIPCFRNKNFMTSAKVALIRPYTIPADSEVVLPAKIKNGGGNNQKLCVVSPSDNTVQNQGMLVCNALTVPTSDTVPIRVFNYTDKPIRLFKGKVMGKIEPVVGFSCLKTEDINQPCTCDCDCIPTYTGKVSKKTKKPDYTRPCCHKLLNLSEEARNTYVWNYSVDNSDLIYKSFESHPDVPEHVKELYQQTLPKIESVRQRNRLAYLMSTYSDVFAAHGDDIGRTDLVKHHVDTGDHKPVHQRCRRFARTHVDIIREHVQKLAANGTIRPSNSEWAANCVVVKKKDGGHRVCIDYRDLNAVTLNPDSYLIPRIDDTLDALGGAKYFCTLDLIWGYHAIELTEESKPKTAFHAPYCNPSQWEYNYMPFGLVRAPRTFQRMMDKVIQGLEYQMALCYIDDVIVYGPTLDICMDRMQVVFERIRNAKLKLKAKKCILFSREVKFLGHVISKDGVKTDPEKVKSIIEWHPPKTVKQVRSFLGMVIYYSRFIPNLAVIASPLHDLTKLRAKFRWGSKEQTSFDILKAKLASAPVMAYPRSEGKFILDTDASDYGYGAVLSQLQTDEFGEEHEKPIAYYSKKFTERERKYCARKRELLAIVNSVKHFDVYLRGPSFMIRTDHASLRYLRTLKQMPAQFFRWIMTLEEYSYSIEVRKGVLHANADAMSRGCHGRDCICEDLLQYERRYNIKKGDIIKADEQPILGFECNTLMDHDISAKCLKGECLISAFKLNPKYSCAELGKMQEIDPDVGPIYRAFVKDPKTKPDWKDISCESAATKSYFNDWTRLTMHGGALYRVWESANGLNNFKQLIVPRALQLEFCHRIHDTAVTAHMGRRKTLHALLHFCYWYKMVYDIRFWIQSCDICQRRKQMQPTPRAPLQIQISGEPNERIAMDIMGPLITTPTGNRYVLCITDYFSKYTQAIAIPDQTAETIANQLVKHWLHVHGEPDQIHTDQGRNFESELMEQLCNVYNIEKTRTSPYHPQSDGQVERFNKTVMNLVFALNQETEKWDEILQLAVTAYNSTIHESTGFTPNLLWYGRELKFTIGRLVPDPVEAGEQTYCEYINKLKRKVQQAFDVARNNLRRSALHTKKYYDRKLHFIDHKPGNRVLLLDHSPVERGTRKLGPRYVGPYFVLDKVGLVNFRIQDKENSEPRVVHHNRLRPYLTREPFEIPEWVRKLSKSDVPKMYTPEIIEGKPELPAEIIPDEFKVKAKIQPRKRKTVKLPVKVAKRAAPKRPAKPKSTSKLKMPEKHQNSSTPKLQRPEQPLNASKPDKTTCTSTSGAPETQRTTRSGRRVRPPDRLVC